MQIKEHDQTCKLMQTCTPINISFGEVGASSSATAWGGVGGVFGICEATSGIKVTGAGVPEQLAGLAAGTGGGGGGACHLAPGGGGLGRF